MESFVQLAAQSKFSAWLLCLTSGLLGQIPSILKFTSWIHDQKGLKLSSHQSNCSIQTWNTGNRTRRSVVELHWICYADLAGSEQYCAQYVWLYLNDVAAEIGKHLESISQDVTAFIDNGMHQVSKWAGKSKQCSSKKMPWPKFSSMKAIILWHFRIYPLSWCCFRVSLLWQFCIASKSHSVPWWLDTTPAETTFFLLL